MRRSIRTFGSAFAALALTAGLIGGTATSAGADTGPHHWMHTDRFENGGRLDFWPVNDHVKICDEVADGRGVGYVVWNQSKDPDVKEYSDVITRGAGECNNHDADHQPGNLAEGDCFSFAIWLTDNGEVVGDTRDEAYWRNYNDATVECPDVG
jgi:hypothetical protein